MRWFCSTYANYMTALDHSLYEINILFKFACRINKWELGPLSLFFIFAIDMSEVAKTSVSDWHIDILVPT